MITTIMREEAACLKANKEKYPGLPKYNCSNLEIYKLMAFGDNSLHPSNDNLAKVSITHQ